MQNIRNSESLAQPHQTRAKPTGASGRLEFVDILRGMALLFILIENMPLYSGQAQGLEALSQPIDRALMIAIIFLLQAKSYSLLSFLFGWGAAVQRERIQAGGGRFVPFFLRRMGVLLLLGVLHGTLIWFGDVLVLYAAMGLVLLFFVRLSPRALLVAGLVFLAFTVFVNVPGEGMDVVRAWYARATAVLRSERYPVTAYTTGPFRAIAQRRTRDLLSSISWFIYYFGSMFGMFLLGAYAAKRRLLRDAERHTSLLRRIAWLALAIGLVGNELYVEAQLAHWAVPVRYERLVLVGTRTIGAVSFVLLAVAAVALISRREGLYRRLLPLASVGRMSISNYLFQSVVCTTIFYSYGLGLYGEIGLTFGTVVAAIIYAAQLRLSEWWLERYRFGPVEWLWRTLSYGRRVPLRLSETEDDPSPGFWRTALRRLRGTDRRAAYAALFAIGVLACGAGLWYWSREPVEVIETRETVVRVTPTRKEVDEVGAFVIETPVVEPVTYQPGPIAASGDLLALASAFDPQRARDEIAALTGPPFLGRYPSSPGSIAAAEYIAQRFAEYGLQPAGERNTFFQPFPVEYVTLAAEPFLAITTTAGIARKDYVPYRDFSPIARWYAGEGVSSGQVVWGSDCTREDLGAVEAAGKVLLCRNVPPVDAGRNALEHGAGGLLLLTDPESRPPDFGEVRGEPWVPAPIPSFRVFPLLVEEMLSGSGLSVEDLTSSFTSFPLGAYVRMEVDTAGSEQCPQPMCQGRNVLGVLPGRDPVHASKVVILGAHYDHLGEAPGGTTWVGANDDASGVAVLLEIARIWHEQGYVPRRTVLFAAWDAEEMGLIGSRHYVAQPRYPLTDTVAMIQLDMVGTGVSPLRIDGDPELGERLTAVADALDVVVALSQEGRSDHVPFWQAGIPASLLIWSTDESALPHYHRPLDTVDTIEVDKLATVGRIAGITLLGYTEGDLAVADLVAERASAVEQGDREAFLSTSTADLRGRDGFWYEDVRSLNPSRVKMTARDIRVYGRTATASVQIEVAYADQDGRDRALSASLSTAFAHGDRGWLWAGPDLIELESDREQAFLVRHPPGLQESLEGLGQRAAERYARVAGVLGLPERAGAALTILPNAESLRASTALARPIADGMWVVPGEAKLSYSSAISTSVRLDDAIVRLVLADAGVTMDTVPWLWKGLPIVLRPHLGHTAPAYLAELQDMLTGQAAAEAEASDWAAAAYLHEQLGWAGLGRLISQLGRECRGGQCERPEQVDAVVLGSLGVDASTFEDAWRSYWGDRLASVQAGLNELLAARSGAVLSGDLASFLNTVDEAVPALVAEEEYWFADLARDPVEAFSLSGRPLAVGDDGLVTAAVELRYRLVADAAASTASEKTISFVAQVSPRDDGYRWAGVPFESLVDDGATILYPAGAREQAVALLPEMGETYHRLANRLGVEQPGPLVIKVYHDDVLYQASIGLSRASGNRIRTWSAPGTSVKLRLSDRAMTRGDRSAMVGQMARHLLAQRGVDDEWLLQGVSLYLADDLGDGSVGQTLAGSLGDVLEAAAQPAAYDLRDVPRDDELPGEESRVVSAWAWDTVRYLVYMHGEAALLDLLDARGDGLDLDTAMRSATGQGVSDFAAAWQTSLSRAHADWAWVGTAQSFDGGRASEHVTYLSGPSFAGRQAGSREATAAAEYVATRFADYGLDPVGDTGVATYTQHFPISYTMLLEAPHIELLDRDGWVLGALTYRQDFVDLLHEVAGWGEGVGQLVWVRDANYAGIELGGKVVVRIPSLSVEQEVARAAEHGASGLLLVGKTAGQKRPLAKQALPVTYPVTPTIPVLELTQQGYDQLLELARQTRSDVLDSLPALPLDLWARIGIPLQAPRDATAVNVLGLLPGTDPVLRERVVLLSAHYDHVGDDPGSWVCPPGESVAGRQRDERCELIPGRRYPGANDNASGIGVLLEIARLWHDAGYRPKHSVLFAAWGAQEAGQTGMQHYLDHPVVPLHDVIAVFHLEAVGGGEGYYLGAQGSKEQEGLLRFAMQSAEDVLDGRLTLTSPPTRNDPAALLRQAGLPTLWMSWRDASEENWPIDHADQVEPYRLGVTGRMVTLAVMSLAR